MLCLSLFVNLLIGEMKDFDNNLGFKLLGY